MTEPPSPPSFPSKFHRLLRRLDGDAHHAGCLRISTAVFDVLSVSDCAVFGFSGVGSLLARALIRSDSGLLVYFGAGIPKDDLRGDIPTDGFAVLKQRDARLGGAIEPVVGLAHHRRQGQSISRHTGDREFIGCARSDRARSFRADGRIENPDRLYSLAAFERLGKHTRIAVLGLRLKALTAILLPGSKNRRLIGMHDRHSGGETERPLDAVRSGECIGLRYVLDPDRELGHLGLALLAGRNPGQSQNQTCSYA